jgi:hypothetical protein
MVLPDGPAGIAGDAERACAPDASRRFRLKCPAWRARLRILFTDSQHLTGPLPEGTVWPIASFRILLNRPGWARVERAVLPY